MRRLIRTGRYLRSWLTGGARVEEREVEIARGDTTVPCTLLMPPGARRRPLPAWIVLHGMTRPGRAHVELRRFVRALAASRAVVLVPEIAEWRRLELSAEVTLPTVRGALELLRTVPEAEAGRTALVGFSFGSPQAILCAEDPSVREAIDGVVGFGGYCDLERTLRFQLTGVHEWEGRLHRMSPDPYGRWIVGANFLRGIPGLEHAGAVADALWTLAAEAGDRRIPAWDPSLRARAEALRRTLDAHERRIFDWFTPPRGAEPEPDEVEELVVALAEAGRRSNALLDPGDRLEEVDRTVHLLHGRGDRLIPYTEALRLERRIGRAGTRPGATDVRCTVTALFAHSRGDERPPPGKLLREGLRFAGALAGILDAPEGGARGSGRDGREPAGR